MRAAAWWKEPPPGGESSTCWRRESRRLNGPVQRQACAAALVNPLVQRPGEAPLACSCLSPHASALPVLACLTAFASC